MKRSNSERDFIFSRNVHRSAINKFVSELIYHVDIIKSMLSSFHSSRSQYYDGGGGGGELPEDSGMGVRPVSQNPYFIKEKKICYFPYLIYKTCPLSKRKCP